MTTRCQQVECLLAGVYYNGAPIVTGYARFYEPGTTTLKSVYPDALKSGSAFSELELETDGTGVAYADGAVDVKVYEGDPDDGGTLRKTFSNVKCESVAGDNVTKTANYTADPDDWIVFCNTSSSGFTISFTTVANYTHPIWFVKTSASNTLTYDPYSTETANGASAITSTGLYDTFIFIPDTSSWKVVEVKRNSMATITASDTITVEEHEGKTILLAEPGGDAAVTATLPAATGSGNRYLFVVGIVNTSNYLIKVDSASAVMDGNILTNSTGDAATDAVQTWLAGATADTITLNGTTTGGASIGDWVELIDIGTNQWMVRGMTTSSGSEATPFSATV